MPSLKSSRHAHRDDPPQTLKQRAAALRAAAARHTARPPTDLAGACAWASAHRTWIDAGQNLDDAGLDLELERIDDVFRRAASEPSRGPHEAIAKARMLLDGLRAPHSLTDTPDKRLIPVVLRELIALADAGLTLRGACEAGEEALGPAAALSGFDVSNEPLEVLLSLHDIADTLAGIGSAITCQPLAAARHDGSAVSPNAAGRFAHWLVDIADLLSRRVRTAARQRVASDTSEREQRLRILADATIANGDRAEMLAFLADLAAYACSDL